MGGFSSIRNHKLFATYNLYLLKKKKSCFCFNISAFYFYFGPLQVHVIWGTMNKCSLSLWYCWFSYGFSLLQAGNFSLFHGSSDRSYTIPFFFFIVFCCNFSCSISFSEKKWPWLHADFSSWHNENLENIIIPFYAQPLFCLCATFFLIFTELIFSSRLPATVILSLGIFLMIGSRYHRGFYYAFIFRIIKCKSIYNLSLS